MAWVGSTLKQFKRVHIKIVKQQLGVKRALGGVNVSGFCCLMSSLPMRETMIRANAWQQLEMANRELMMCLEWLRKVRARGDTK